VSIGRPGRKADNLTAICEPIAYKMWKPRRLTTLWPSRAVTGISLPNLLHIIRSLIEWAVQLECGKGTRNNVLWRNVL
jgi:hypothetical protein